jgi:hypothetical protein
VGGKARGVQENALEARAQLAAPARRIGGHLQRATAPGNFTTRASSSACDSPDRSASHELS